MKTSTIQSFSFDTFTHATLRLGFYEAVSFELISPEPLSLLLTLQKRNRFTFQKHGHSCFIVKEKPPS